MWDAPAADFFLCLILQLVLTILFVIGGFGPVVRLEEMASYAMVNPELLIEWVLCVGIFAIAVCAMFRVEIAIFSRVITCLQKTRGVGPEETMASLERSPLPDFLKSAFRKEFQRIFKGKGWRKD